MKLKKKPYHSKTGPQEPEDFFLYVRPEDEAEAVKALLSESYDARKSYFNTDDDRSWRGFFD